MSKKIPWQVIYDDFKSRFPRLRKQAVNWFPYGFLTIVIYISDGRKMVYDYLEKKASFLSEDQNWKKG